MKENRLLEALSEVEDKFVEEIDDVAVSSEEKEHITRRKGYGTKQWLKWIAIAAVLVLVFVIGGQYLQQDEQRENQFSASIRNGCYRRRIL